MLVLPMRSRDRRSAEPEGHLIGFVETELECVKVIRGLIGEGFADSEISVVRGREGIYLLRRMMNGLIGEETSDEVLQKCRFEFALNHFAIIIDVQDHQRALAAADASKRLGAYGLTDVGIRQLPIDFN